MDSSVDSINYVEVQSQKEMLFIVVILLGLSVCGTIREEMMNINNV